MAKFAMRRFIRGPDRNIFLNAMDMRKFANESSSSHFFANLQTFFANVAKSRLHIGGLNLVIFTINFALVVTY